MNETNSKVIIHRGDPRFCRPITVGGNQVGLLEPSADHNGHRLPYEVQLLNGTSAMFDTLAEARVWVERKTTTATIIEVPATSIRVGDTICATAHGHRPGGRRSGGENWFPHETVTAVEVMDHEDGWILVGTTTVHGDYAQQAWFDPSWTFHIIARSIGDELIGRGKS